MAAWAPLVPAAQVRAGLSDPSLGLLLLCMGAGSIVAMPLAGAMVLRFGCRASLLGAGVLMGLALPLLAVVSAPALLAAVLFAFGAGVGSVDCVMNIQGVIVERASQRAMMSGFHGLFSLGGIVGAAGVSILLGLGASPLLATLCVAAGIAVALGRALPGMLAAGGQPGPAFAVPRGLVLGIGLVCFVMFLTEGAVLDWSAVLLTSRGGAPSAYAGFGYAAFALTMTVGRLFGDRLVARLGGYRVVLGGTLCAAAGLAVVVVAPAWWMGVAGYALVGAGCSNIVPVLYTAAGRQRAMPEHLAIPAITTLGYAGILAGPGLIGLGASLSSLPTAFLAVAVCCCWWWRRAPGWSAPDRLSQSPPPRRSG